jgi:hypothetical protein
MSRPRNLLTPLFLLFSLSLSGCRIIGPTEAEQDFYESYPDLKNKIHNLSTYVQHNPFREGMRYYRFQIEPHAAEKFLNAKRFVNLSSFKSKRERRDKLIFDSEIKCDHQFIDLVGNFYLYQLWWNPRFSSDTTCYLVLPNHPHNQRKAIYDKQSKTLFLHFYFAG